MNGHEEPFPQCAVLPISRLPELAQLPLPPDCNMHLLGTVGATEDAMPAAEILLIPLHKKDERLAAMLAGITEIHFLDCENGLCSERSGTDNANRRKPSEQPEPINKSIRHETTRNEIQLQFADSSLTVRTTLGEAKPLAAWIQARLPGQTVDVLQTGRHEAGSMLDPDAEVILQSIRLPAGMAMTSEPRGLLLPATSWPELQQWVRRIPPVRATGLQWTTLESSVWIEAPLACESRLPPLNQGQRFRSWSGSFGSSAWIPDGLYWSPSLSVDVLLETIHAVPAQDYLLMPDGEDRLHFRHCIVRAELLPLTRANVSQ